MLNAVILSKDMCHIKIQIETYLVDAGRIELMRP
ncbi:hypothetical protein SKA53_05133 [Yoonia vestfoldensis SKA53]|uniref:Uncharacterized protein n=1 Tax=Yoonia vestfoldensis SKA53 TaxID=314232 RepID=A3V6C0_9RHOB|nr:hypothetical protein SKA53_05133 [Yoonia vestfoldensis SKA53]